MDVGLESVQTCLDGPSVHVAKALLHPELELVLSLGFLASLATNPFRIQKKKKSSTGWSLGTCGGFCFLWHIRHEEPPVGWSLGTCGGFCFLWHIRHEEPPVGGVWGHVEGFASCGTYGMKSSSNKA